MSEPEITEEDMKAALATLSLGFAGVTIDASTARATIFVAKAIAIARAAGEARERDALTAIAKDRVARCGHRAGTCRSCMEDGAIIDIIAARNRGGGAK